MKIWDLGLDIDNYKNLALISKKEISILLSKFNGKSMADTWKPLEIKFIDDDRDLKVGDAANLFIGTPVVNIKTVKLLDEFFKDAVEALKLSHKEVEYFILNVIKVVDCLDTENSEFEKYPDTGEIMWCKKYKFIPEKVNGHNIFKIPQTLRGLVLVSDEFRDRVLKSDLHGFKFEELWDSEKA